MIPNKFRTLLDKRGHLLLDGGLATELEKMGHDLSHPLWSSKLLIESPEDIKRVHKSYISAGSNCLTTASYQLSFAGGQKIGLSQRNVSKLLLDSVQLAQLSLEELDLSMSETHMIAASLGPYGAYLTNGSEYTGEYYIAGQALQDFHIRRVEILASSTADLIAFETIPNVYEAEVLRKMMEEFPEIPYWISFSCRNEMEISDGTKVSEVADIFSDCPSAVGIGINCTSPTYISSLIKEIAKGAPNKTIIAYPNSGQTYDAASRTWMGIQDENAFGRQSLTWFEEGATVLGGCCQTGPEHIETIKQNIDAIRSID